MRFWHLALDSNVFPNNLKPRDYRQFMSLLQCRRRWNRSVQECYRGGGFLLLSIGRDFGSAGRVRTFRRLPGQVSGSRTQSRRLYPKHLQLGDQERYDIIRGRVKEIDSLLRKLDRTESSERPASYSIDISRLRQERQELHRDRSTLESGDPTFRDAPLDYAEVRGLMSDAQEAVVYLQPLEDVRVRR